MKSPRSEVNSLKNPSPYSNRHSMIWLNNSNLMTWANTTWENGKWHPMKKWPELHTLVSSLPSKDFSTTIKKSSSSTLNSPLTATKCEKRDSPAPHPWNVQTWTIQTSDKRPLPSSTASLICVKQLSLVSIPQGTTFLQNRVRGTKSRKSRSPKVSNCIKTCKLKSLICKIQIWIWLKKTPKRKRQSNRRRSWRKCLMSLSMKRMRRISWRKRRYKKSRKRASTKRCIKVIIAGKKWQLTSKSPSKTSKTHSSPVYEDCSRSKSPKLTKNSKTSTPRTKCSPGRKPPPSSTNKSSANLKVTAVSTTTPEPNTPKSLSSKKENKSLNTTSILKGPKPLKNSQLKLLNSLVKRKRSKMHWEASESTLTPMSRLIPLHLLPLKMMMLNWWEQHH